MFDEHLTVFKMREHIKNKMIGVAIINLLCRDENEPKCYLQNIRRIDLSHR